LFNFTKNKLIIFLLIFSFLPLFIMRLVVYPIAFNALRDEIIRNLRLAVNKQAELIAAWMEGRLSNARYIANNPFLIQAMQKTGNALTIEVNEYFKSICSDFGYKEIFYADRNGKILFASNKALYGENILEQDYYRRAIAGAFFVSNIQSSLELTGNVAGFQEADTPAMIMSLPVKNAPDAILGVLAVCVDVAEIDRVMKSVHFGKTGEAYLINKNGYMLTTSRFTDELLQADRIKKRASLELKIVDPYTKKPTKGALECINGGEGYDAHGYPDYRGVRVLGFWHWMPDYDWGVIAEIDVNEGYGKLYTLRDSVMFVFAFLAMGIVIVVFLLVKKVTLPYR